MNLHQFRFIHAAVRHQLNLTKAAGALHTSQPGLSKAILELEDELGISIFNRHGKRLTGLTEPGKQVLGHIEIILRELANLKRVGEQFGAKDQGTLRIALTHTQARYTLPPFLSEFRKMYPKLTISLHQGTPTQVAQMLADEVADMGMATEVLGEHPQLVSLPCYEWQHVVVLPRGHALTEKFKNKSITLLDIAREPLITYHPSFTGRGDIDAAFAAQDLEPKIALEAMDADVIQTYVRLGLGLGIVAEMAAQETAKDLLVYPAGHLFGHKTTRLAFKRGAYLPEFVYALATLLNENIHRESVAKAMQDSFSS